MSALRFYDLPSSLLRTAAIFGCIFSTVFATDAATHRVYFGTYTGKNSQGIYCSDFDALTGQLQPAVLAAESAQPSFLAVHPNGRYLYAVNELNDYLGKSAGAVSAFKIDRKSTQLTPINQQSSGGSGPCHVVVDPAGTTVLIANYAGGSVASYRIQPDGGLGPAVSFVQHSGKGANPQRQEGPHAHSIYVDAAGRYAIVADLGLDRMLVYRFNPADSSLTPHNAPLAAWASGAGPRHFAFHPNGRWGYAINEMASTVTALAYDKAKGQLTSLSSISTLPPGLTLDTSTAEIFAHPSGKFIYGSNRGHDSIAVFQVDPKSGSLRVVQHQPTGGKVPRGFGIDPTGRWLLAANQSSGSVVVFEIDRKNGTLRPTGESIAVGSPVSVHFLRL
ncbi:MAG: lactonase family protein [Verrucomicrobia bacterium]|nr:lactonase family protein [Verrucomicrobiota bacterium]MBI3868183.1 lactonase family protein [Verrucomicrobiota bacterium]